MKKDSLYLPSGYMDPNFIMKKNLPFNFITGGRGTGKTYGFLKYLYENKIKFMYMRRTQNEVDLINKPQFTPYKSLNEDMGWNVGVAPISKYNAAFYNMEYDETNDKNIPTGEPLGFTCALSTIAKMRGFDASDIKILLYDEFIPEKHAQKIRYEGQAFLNAYETINRNRELMGFPPLICVCLSNSNSIANAIYITLMLVNKAVWMKKNDKEFSIDSKRGIGLYLLDSSPISKLKEEKTAIGQLTKGTEYGKMAYGNEFADADESAVRPQKLIEYRPLVTVGEITIYRHKSKKIYYVSALKSGQPKEILTSGETDLIRFSRNYSYLYDAYLDQRLFFESMVVNILFSKYFNML